MVMMAARNTAGSPAATNAMGMPALGTKRPRKPYTISRPREKWTSDEHDRFLHALLVFGRDWKTIEQFVGTKTSTQIRSHAQKYFLKVHKMGLAAALPPPHPRRAAVLQTAGAPLQSAADWTAASCTVAGPRLPAHNGSFTAAMSSSGNEEVWFADALLHQEKTVHLPLSPDDLRFAKVYRFVGDVFGSGAPRPVEPQLQRLHAMDHLVAETILLVLGNLQDNLCA